ncbi:MAG TPA: NAD(P)/FAD-dependent oxidoreductase, partial [Burkholderiales bacterium]|nr:NAD(P)/FAD-dependent oxidoreductase [Burkholderiales bacterium]
NSTLSYTVSLLHPSVIRDLHLAEHGLRIVERPVSNFLPLSDTEYLKIGPTYNRTQAEVARHSKRDAERLASYYAMLEHVADLLRELALRTPPNIGGGLRDMVAGIKAGGLLRRLDMEARRDVLDLFAKSAGELLDAWFESDAVKAAFAFDSIVGNFASPYTPGTAYVLLHHVFGEVNGRRGAWGHALGGMGAITQAMATEARSLGVEIETDCEVARITVDERGAHGVELSDGRAIEARCVVANVNPKLLYTRLIDANVLDAPFLDRIRRWKCGSATFRMNVALSELPDFLCLPGATLQEHHQSGIIIAPSMRYMEQAYFDARTYGCSRAPVVEMLIPSTVDESLAPPGRHVASLFCQHFNPELPNQLDWDEIREPAADLVIDTVARYAPNFKNAILGRAIYTPLDLEREFALTGGDIFHGALTLDQLWSARPMLGYADYRGPVKKLYMCGSGTHPGGGVTGLPGRNAAGEILRDLGTRARAR